MPTDLAFDPVSQDEILEPNGSPRLTPHADTAVQHAFLIHYGEAWQAPEIGSRFHALDLFQADPAPLAESEAPRVLEGLIAAGRISRTPEPEVKAEVDARIGRLSVATTFRDANTGNIVTTKVRTGG